MFADNTFHQYIFLAFNSRSRTAFATVQREGSRQIALEYSAKIADGRYGDIFTFALVMQEYENKDLGISGALAQTAKVATIDKVADEVISSTSPLAAKVNLAATQKAVYKDNPSWT